MHAPGHAHRRSRRQGQASRPLGVSSSIHPAGGFTLIEVLVALSIVAIALMAGQQASQALTRNATRQVDVMLGQVCAENELVKVRLSKQMPGVGDTEAPCEQGGRQYRVELTVRPTPNPSFRRVDARVLADSLPVVQLTTIVGRF
jgi:general secretion pathway protein I